MRVNGIRCDTCCKEQLFAPSLMIQSVHEVLPDGWFMLLCGKYEHGKEPLVLCSVDCLSQWAGKQVALAREATQTTEYKERLKAIEEQENW